MLLHQARPVIVGPDAAAIAQRRKERLEPLTFADQLQKIRGDNKGIYDRVDIDLSVARSIEKLSITGSYIYIHSTANDPAATMDLRLWDASNPSITVKMRSIIRAPFDTLFITNTAQANKTLTIFISRDPDIFELEEASDLSADILAELQGGTNMTGVYKQFATDTVILAANTSRKSIFVCADPTNTVDLMLGNTNAVAAAQNGNTFARLLPGQTWACDDYRGAVWGEAADAATNIRIYANEVT